MTGSTAVRNGEAGVPACPAPRANGRPVRLLGWILLPAMLCAGCAMSQRWLNLPEDISPKRQAQNARTVQQFDQQRDFAEFTSAQALWEEGDEEGCRHRLQALLERNPEHLDARLLLAEVQLTGDQPHEALQTLEPALKAHPNNARVHYALALLFDAIGQRDAALAHYEQAVKIEPDNEVYQVSYQQVAGEDLVGSSPVPPPPGVDRPGALALAANDDNSRHPYSLGTSPRKDPADEGSAPPRISARFVAADGQNGQNGQAARNGRAEAIDPTVEEPASAPDDLLQRGCQAMAEGNPQLAMAYFERVMADRPDDPQVPIAAGVSALRYNRPDVAVEILEPAAQRFPRSASIHRILGAAYYRRGDYRASQVALWQALSLDKSNALSYFLMGCTLVKLGQEAAAQQHFRQAHLLDPKYPVRR